MEPREGICSVGSLVLGFLLTVPSPDPHCSVRGGFLYTMFAGSGDRPVPSVPEVGG